MWSPSEVFGELKCVLIIDKYIAGSGTCLHQLASRLAALKDAIMASREVLPYNEWTFPRWQVCHPLQSRGSSQPLHSPFFVQPGENCYLKTKSVYVIVICTTLHRFLVVISTNVSIQQNFSSCIQLMVGELFSSLYYGLWMCYLVTMVDPPPFLPKSHPLGLGSPQVAQQQFLKHAGTCLMVQNHGLETHMNYSPRAAIKDRGTKRRLSP